MTGKYGDTNPFQTFHNSLTTVKHQL